jgi:hypothetical protein
MVSEAGHKVVFDIVSTYNVTMEFENIRVRREVPCPPFFKLDHIASFSSVLTEVRYLLNKVG